MKDHEHPNTWKLAQHRQQQPGNSEAIQQYNRCLKLPHCPQKTSTLQALQKTPQAAPLQQFLGDSPFADLAELIAQSTVLSLQHPGMDVSAPTDQGKNLSMHFVDRGISATTGPDDINDGQSSCSPLSGNFTAERRCRKLPARHHRLLHYTPRKP
ncbi:hypothetical protein D3C78_1046100 [compost metagenome]